MNRLMWFRSDLRVRDNPALWHACQQSQPVIGLYFICEQQWQKHGLGPRRINLMKARAQELKKQLAELNIPLIILAADDFTHSTDILKALISDLSIAAVNFNIEYEINERQRDYHVSRWLRDQQIEVNKFHDQCLLPPGDVRTKTDQPFRVFSPFKRAWLPKADDAISAPFGTPTALPQSAQALLRLLPADREPYQHTAQSDNLWSVDENNAHDKLERFIDEQIKAYKTLRDLPDTDATSRLSFELALGILSPRQCFYAAMQKNHGLLAGGNQGIDCWISELIWREFYRHLLVAYPELCKHRAFKPETEQLQWRQADEDFAAWCEGRTGYPIVDAAMKQLLEQGWMHNRLRMITAMFLTKHLLIDWRRGEAFFNYWLVDADLASNNGGWQWSASTGADGAPYFRIFNPTSQSEKFDADGRFIARMLPELAALPAPSRHNPDAFSRQQVGYPQPIVDHKAGRERALAAFKNLTPIEEGA